jgi:hypothetical protein
MDYRDTRGSGRYGVKTPMPRQQPFSF